MLSYPISYDEPLFRPPSEAQSLILQLTFGCSWNQCRFCEMYSTKRFRVRPQEDVFADIAAFAPYKQHIRRIFLADGDPLVLDTSKLLTILERIKSSFPRLTRISAYASPRNLNAKSIEELKSLKEAGLDLLYVGIESGDDEVLRMINKGETFDSSKSALLKAQEAGLHCSVMIINGLGGREHMQQHALQSARLINEIQPKYLSTLVLTHYKGFDYFQSRLEQEFTPLKPVELLQEMELFMESLDLDATIYRSDHASNSLVLKGVLGRDKENFLQKIKATQAVYSSL